MSDNEDPLAGVKKQFLIRRFFTITDGIGKTINYPNEAGDKLYNISATHLAFNDDDFKKIYDREFANKAVGNSVLLSHPRFKTTLIYDVKNMLRDYYLAHNQPVFVNSVPIKPPTAPKEEDLLITIDLFLKYLGLTDKELTTHLNELLYEIEKASISQINPLQALKIEMPSNIPSPVDKKFRPQTLRFTEEPNLEMLYTILKVYIEDPESNLKGCLQGNPLKEKLLFKGNQNQFVELFRRLLYNHRINGSYVEVREWICANFEYIPAHGQDNTPHSFNKTSVYDVLKGVNQVKKNNRIGEGTWLPFKTNKQVQDDKKGY